MEYIQLEGPLFEAVQLGAIFSDAKTFVDAYPTSEPSEILAAYDQEKGRADFDLKRFALKHFAFPEAEQKRPAKAGSMWEYIDSMWEVLLKEMTPGSPYSTLIPLPKPHIVPGGRFRECFYWDSYFTALGLVETGRTELAVDMAENFASLIDRFGYIPNGNRVYFQSRSQPPYFSHLISLLPNPEPFLPHLEKEYAYWMEHAVGPLNRYWDSENRARPEAFRRETALAKESTDPEFYRQLRVACASGWDFSTRWLRKGDQFREINALELYPLDLNCLLYHMEIMLGKTAEAEQRKNLIQELFWDEEAGFFFDYNFETKSRTKIWSLAAASPLFEGIATPSQAERVARHLEEKFLLAGGFVTTLDESMHQWGMPDGWAPLEWITIMGLRNYGYHELADVGAKRWLDLNEKIFKETGVMLEKYNVRECSAMVAPGEYKLQEGFGWTNGVAIALGRQVGRQ